MNYFLGFDGGGTKTECVLMNRNGTILAQAITGPSNPMRVGFDKAFVELAAATDKVLTAIHADSKQVTGVCAGLAGAGRARVVKRVMAFLVGAFPDAVVHVTTDLEVALEAAVGEGPGVILIAGTGSSAYGRNAGGQKARSGGHGPWIGDEGSAYDIGRRAVGAVARARDSLAPVTLLSEMIPAAMQLPTWESLVEAIAQSPDDVFPRIYPLVVEAAAAEDAPAKEILFAAAFGLSMLANSVIRKLNMEREEFTVAKAGGVHGHSELLDQALNALIVSGAPRAQIRLLDVAPAVGAARMAQRLCAKPAPVPAC